MRRFSSALLLLVFGTCGCALFQNEQEAFRLSTPQEKVFAGRQPDVWRAVQLAMAKYPIQTNNPDSGLIETETITGLSEVAWVPPQKLAKPSPGMNYIIRVSASRGRLNNAEAVRVEVRKIQKIKRDFFANEDVLPSDGLEEHVILYRIQRELEIEKALNRANKS